jgi:hypothetical protein
MSLNSKMKILKKQKVKVVPQQEVMRMKVWILKFAKEWNELRNLIIY